MAEYEATVDFGQGGEQEVTVEVNEEWMFEYITDNGCSEWAENHFEYYCNVSKYVDDYLDNLTQKELLALVGPKLGVEYEE